MPLFPSHLRNKTQLHYQQLKLSILQLMYCYAQVVWMKNTLEDYKVHLKNIPIKCDNTSAICLTKNLIQHSKTKHIDIRHHFIQDHVTNHDVII